MKVKTFEELEKKTSKADKMFEWLGCKKEEGEEYISYYAVNSERGVTVETTIVFRKTTRDVAFYVFLNNEITSTLLGIQLHKAIHEKMKELGWFDEISI